VRRLSSALLACIKCETSAPGNGESGARARPRRSDRDAALSCSAAVLPAPPCAGVRRVRLTLPRCGQPRLPCRGVRHGVAHPCRKLRSTAVASATSMPSNLLGDSRAAKRRPPLTHCAVQREGQDRIALFLSGYHVVLAVKAVRCSRRLAAPLRYSAESASPYIHCRKCPFDDAPPQGGLAG